MYNVALNLQQLYQSS